jgi:hypothetical protein
MTFLALQIPPAFASVFAGLVGLLALITALPGEARATERDSASAEIPGPVLEPVVLADRALPVERRLVEDGAAAPSLPPIPVVPLGFDLKTTIARLAGLEEIEPLGRRELGIDVRPTEDVSRNWFVNEFVHGFERHFSEQTEDLLDEDSVLHGSRIFGARRGLTEPFDEGLGVEEMTAEEKAVLRSGVEAIKDTLSQTDAYQTLYGRIQDVELYFNWSLVHAEQDSSQILRLYTTSEDEGGNEGSADVVSKIDSRFRLASLIDAPDEFFEVRGRLLRHLQFSFYPLSRRAELRTTLMERRGYRLGVTLTEEPGHERLLVIGLTASF